MRGVRSIVTAGILLALLTGYIYIQASTETFVIYLIGLILWASLVGYCSYSGRKQTLKAKH